MRTETLAIRSGEHCPKTGWWQPLQSDEQDQRAPSRFVAQGFVVPDVNGASTFWVQSRMPACPDATCSPTHGEGGDCAADLGAQPHGDGGFDGHLN